MWGFQDTYITAVSAGHPCALDTGRYVLVQDPGWPGFGFALTELHDDSQMNVLLYYLRNGRGVNAEMRSPLEGEFNSPPWRMFETKFGSVKPMPLSFERAGD